MKSRRPRKPIPRTTKQSRLAVILTPKGINLLNQMAKQTGLSKSQLVENFARNSLSQTQPTEAIQEFNQESLTEAQPSSPNFPETITETVFTDKSDYLAQQLQSQQKLTADLHSQIETLETAAKEKDALIEELQGKIASLQSAATIGEWQLNKWRRS